MEGNETTTTETTKPEGFGAALARSPGADGLADAKPEVIRADAGTPAATDTKPAATTETKPGAEAKPGVEAATAQPPLAPHETRGVIRGIQAERNRRQAAEKERDELRARLAQFEGAPAEPPPAAAKASHTDMLEQRLLVISQESAKAAHPTDYDENFAAFAAAAIDKDGNPTAIYDTVINQSDHPGEAAYQAGKALRMQQKYGSDPEAMAAAIRKETEDQMRAKIREEVTAELKGKIAQKNSEPTNILDGGGAAGGDEPVKPIGFGQLLSQGRKRR